MLTEKQSICNNGGIENILEYCRLANQELNNLLFEVIKKISKAGNYSTRISNSELEKDQYLAHGLAWIATYVEGLNQFFNWAEDLKNNENFGEIEKLLLQIGFSEYIAQLRGGIFMSQSEIIRLDNFSLYEKDINKIFSKSTNFLQLNGNSDVARKRLITLVVQKMGSSTYEQSGLGQEYEMIRNQFFKFSKEKITPKAHEWHLKDQLIPMEIISELAELGVFNLNIPELYGGLGMTKTAMCVVSEELSRGYIGVGSLATRSDIAAELILCGGTEEQKNEWLPKIGCAAVLPTAVFTEPNTGSDLGALQTRAVLKNDEYIINGNKTWITHASRANLMAILARSNPATNNHSGLSMFMVEKKSGTTEDPFPSESIKGSEIKVLGYRGMKEYELNFDNLKINKKNLLGNKEGNGFQQLMQTFETARIQTAARAVGVAQNAFDLGLKYAFERNQFGRKIIHFPRIYGKLAIMATELVIARQLTYFSSREKDAGRRCDLQAGMAKMLSARVAWTSADNSLQIHGGNGFALEYPISRVLCDARILNIFEGASEIQAQVIARRILEKRNT